jgi:hypothetical protein
MYLIAHVGKVIHCPTEISMKLRYWGVEIEGLGGYIIYAML